MKLTINIKKRYAYVIIALLIIVLGAIAINAYTNAVPNPGHGGDKILVSVGGAEKTLQQACYL